MFKSRLLQLMDNITQKDNEIRLKLPISKLENKENEGFITLQDYQELISSLVLLAWASPSQHIH